MFHHLQQSSIALEKLVAQVPKSNEHLAEIFREIEGLRAGKYVYGAKLPWHFLFRPNHEIEINYFHDLMVVKISSDNASDVSFTFDKVTGYLKHSCRQICTMWPVKKVEDLEANIKFAYNNLVRYGIKQKK